VIVEHMPNMVRVVQKVDGQRSDAEAEHVAEPLARPKLEGQGVAQELLERAVGERNPVRKPRSRCHAHALRLAA
jgi:hypothetical protein